MADLTPLDEKLGEVLGLAQAAQDATTKVSAMEGAEGFESDLDRMRSRRPRPSAARTSWSTDWMARRRRSARRPLRPRAKRPR